MSRKNNSYVGKEAIFKILLYIILNTQNNSMSSFFSKNMTEIYSKIHVLYRQGIRAVVCNYFKKLKFTIKQTDTQLKTFQNILKHVNLTRSDSIKNSIRDARTPQPREIFSTP